MQTPGFPRRLCCLLYDVLALVAIWMLVSAIFTTLYGNAADGWPRSLLQVFSFLGISGYFVWCWTHGGQTLAMKTWRIRVVDEEGAALPVAGALKRYFLACMGVGLAGIGLWWALMDKDRQFMHDRLAHTRLIMVSSSV